MNKYLLVTILLGLTLLSLETSFSQTNGPLKKEHKKFTLWLDCETQHGAVAFYYSVGKDRGNFDSKSRPFRFDPKVPTSCQPQTWRSYNTTTVNPSEGTWDRGQLVPSNHVDSDRQAVKESFYLSNTLPLNSIFNQPGGAWHKTVLITECYRDITRLKIWGGVIWGKNSDNDFFTVTHGIKTPDFLWKLIYREDKKEYVAWIFPNHWSSKDSKIDDYLIPIEKLKSAVDFLPELPQAMTSDETAIFSKSSWPVTQSDENLSCDGHVTSID